MRKLKKEIRNEGIRFKHEYKLILNCIKKYNRIAIFRHIKPDFDALGSQFGLANWIKDNFPSKEVRCLGDNHVTFTPRGLYPETDKLDDSWFNEEFLAIIVDVGDKKRIADPRFEKASIKIKIDHHPATDNIFDIVITSTEKAAAAEIITNMLLNFKGNYNLSKKTAYYLYTGIVGDSGRFQYNSTSALTFECAEELISRGLNITQIYAKMYEKNLEDLNVVKFIYQNFKISPKGVAYYVLTQKDLEMLNLQNEQGKDNVNLFSNIKGINIWCSITEDITEPCFRVSLRSRDYTINTVATEFKGGGHAQASGCQIKDLSELPLLIEALEKVIDKGKDSN